MQAPRTIAGLLVALAAFDALQAPAIAAPSCKQDKRVVAACFKVRGELSFGGDLLLRLLPQRGTQEIYWIHTAGHGPTDFDPPVPANLSKMLRPDRAIVGDYVVCPFTQSPPGEVHEQTGCIDSARHLASHKNDQD